MPHTVLAPRSGRGAPTPPWHPSPVPDPSLATATRPDRMPRPDAYAEGMLPSVIAVSAHLAAILSVVEPFAPEVRPLDRARGRVLRHPVVRVAMLAIAGVWIVRTFAGEWNTMRQSARTIDIAWPWVMLTAPPVGPRSWV